MEANRKEEKMEQSDERYCSIRESIIESCKEVKLIREGKKPKNKIKDL